MNVALFGATGFVGSYLLDELEKADCNPQVLIRKGSEHKIKPSKKYKIILGDISDTQAIHAVLKDADAIIYTIGVIREFKNISFNQSHFQGVKNVIEEAEKLNIRRFILMSANGVKKDGTQYQMSKYLGELELINSNMDWTILRPSLIFGEPKNDQEFCTQLRDTMIRLPFPAPLFFSGFNIFKAAQFEMSPIHIKNVSEFFVKSIKNDKHYMQTYELGGLQSYNWKEIISIISAAVQKTKWMVPVPVDLIKILAFLFDRFKFFPITRDQITMLLEGNTCQSRQLFNEFDITPIKFSIKNLSYLHQK